ncbi:MAG TPA: GAF domain-containing SpoIIE family protein phosphatase [Solirubrobacteraceae bacterium]|jgi:hypothetical protein|nr:GAF domain-containing SpoIIE family protein phosphatase [Solirubrobacteraceae bacterium]
MRLLVSSAADEAMPRGEVRGAVLSAAGLYATGASLIATSFLLPHVSSPAGAATVAGVAFATAAALVVTVQRGGGGLWLAWVADLWGVVLILALCVSTGGATSPFSLLYFFALGHAAAFQPRGRFLWVCGAVLLAFLTPVTYAHISATFGAFACVGAVLALLTCGAIHLALVRMRLQRRGLEFLITATAMLDTSLDPQQTLRRIAATAVPELAVLCVIDVLGSEGSIATTVADAVEPALARSVEAMHDASPPDLHPHGPIAQALVSGHARVLDSSSDGAEATHADHPHRELMRESGYGTLAAIPMVARGRMLGVISFLRREPFDGSELALLEDLTGRASLAFDNARLYAERAYVAHTLRHSLMPAALPAVRGLQLESFFQPMSAGSEVGGDFYDVFGDRDDCWMVVGDVCGKGAEAAVLTGFLRHTTVAYAHEGEGPADVLTRVNSAMLEHDFDGRFATVILAHLEFHDAGVLVTIAAAGHPPALVTRANGGAEELGACGTLLGVFPDPRIPETRTLLVPGDALALYTDGLAEAQAPDRILTPEQMIEKLGTAPPRSAREAIDALLGLVDLRDGARDDIAILVARVEKAPAERSAGTHAASRAAG